MLSEITVSGKGLKIKCRVTKEKQLILHYLLSFVKLCAHSRHKNLASLSTHPTPEGQGMFHLNGSPTVFSDHPYVFPLPHPQGARIPTHQCQTVTFPSFFRAALDPVSPVVLSQQNNSLVNLSNTCSGLGLFWCVCRALLGSGLLSPTQWGSNCLLCHSPERSVPCRNLGTRH